MSEIVRALIWDEIRRMRQRKSIRRVFEGRLLLDCGSTATAQLNRALRASG